MAKRCGPNRSRCGMSQGLYNPFFQNGAQWYGASSGGGSTPSFDTAANTNASNQQVWPVMGADSILAGSNGNDGDTGPPTSYTGIVFERIFNTSTNDLKDSDLANAASGTMLKNLGLHYYQKTGYKMVFSQSAVAGSNWAPRTGDNGDWSTSDTLYTTGKTRTDEAVSAIGVSEPRGFICNAGINDVRGDTDLTIIEAAIYSFFSRINTDYPGVPVYVINIGRAEPANWDAGKQARAVAIRGYIDAAVAQYDHMHVILRLEDYIATTGIYYTDGLHLSQYGNDFIGGKIVYNMLENGLISDTPVTYSYGATSSDVFSKFSQAPSDDEKKIINDFVEYLQEQGEWALYDRVHCFGLSTEANSLQCWKNPAKQMTNIGATWGLRQFFTGGAAAANRLNTNFIPSTEGVNYTANSASAFEFVMDHSQASGVTAVLAGAIGSTSNRQSVITQASTGGILWRINDGATNTLGTGQIKKFCSYIRRRTAVNNAVLNEEFTSQIKSTGTILLPDVQEYLFCRNNNGVADFPHQAQISVWIRGSGAINHVKLLKVARKLTVDLMLLA